MIYDLWLLGFSLMRIYLIHNFPIPTPLFFFLFERVDVDTTIRRPVGDSCLGAEKKIAVQLRLGCPVTWSQGVQLATNPCYSSGNTSRVWPICVCLRNSNVNTISRQRKRSPHKFTSSRWRYEGGSCASGFSAGNVRFDK